MIFAGASGRATANAWETAGLARQVRSAAGAGTREWTGPRQWADSLPSALRRVPWPWWLLAPWSALSAALQAHGAGQSWHFFAEGGRLLVSGGPAGGLHLYATHPVLQIGPLALGLSAMLQVLGSGTAQVIAIVAMSATGVPLLAAVWRLLPGPERGRRGRLLVAGLVFLPVWTELTTHFGHLDDVMALSLAVTAVHAVSRRHPVWAGVALAAAVDSKPWAAAFVPLLLALPRKDRLAAFGAFGAGVSVAWLPFLVADPHSLTAARFTIPNDYSSALRAIGVNSAGTPSWDRLAQLALGVAVGCVAVRRGRWPAVILLAVTARILLDPGVYAYYTSGAVLGTVIFDLLVTRWRLPWTTAAAAALLYAARFTEVLYPFTLHELGVLRAAFGIAVPVGVLFLPDRWMGRRPGRHARVTTPRNLILSARPQQAAPRTATGGTQEHARGPWEPWDAHQHQPQRFPGPPRRVPSSRIDARHDVSGGRRSGRRAGAGRGGPGRR